MLKPLIADRNKIEVRQVGSGTYHTLAALARGATPALIGDPAAARVPSKASGVFLNYHEVWKPSSRDEYLLERAYLHLHLAPTSRESDRQILCLHCDPLTATGDVSHSYKRGPHLHILGGNPNIDKAHVALCINDEGHGGATVIELTKSLSAAITMIGREFLPHYRFG